jgi:hypothetical protein
LHPIGLLIAEIVDLLHIQVLLIDDEILIRGGVTVGKVSVSENRVFGPGLIEAYDIESKFARYPRIVVSQKALKCLEDTDKPLSECHDRSYDKEQLPELLRQGDDGFWFIDYVAVVAEELEPPEAYADFLKRHRDVIVARSAGLPETELANEVVSHKWLAQYHNRCIGNLRADWLSEHGLTRSELLIHPDDLPTWYAF